MKREIIVRELANTEIRSTHSYYKVLSGILEERIGVSLDVKVKETPHNDIITFSQGENVVSRFKRSHGFRGRSKSLDEQVQGATNDLATLFRTVKGKGVC